MHISDNNPDTVSSVALGGGTSLAVMFLRDSLKSMIPFLITAGILIFVDAVFGVACAMKRKDFSFTTLFRKTIGKIFEYICWVTLSSSLSLAFQIPKLQHFILAIVLGLELWSVFRNWAYVSNIRINAKGGLKWWKPIGKHFGIDLDDVEIEQIEEDKQDDPDNKEL